VSLANPTAGDRRRGAPGAWVLAAILLFSLDLTGLASAAAVPAACSFGVGLEADPTAGNTPLLVHFNASVSSGTPSSYNWSFGDGSYWNSSVPGAATPLHRFSSDGLYSTHVAVTEGSCTVVASVSVAAVAGPLSVLLVAHPLAGTVPLTVVFNATVAGGSGTYAAASWNFGDGGEGSGLDVAYTYVHPGTFTALLNVTDSGGHWEVATQAIDAQARASGGSGTPFGLLPSFAYLAGAAAFAGVAGFLVYRRVRPEDGAQGPSSSSPEIHGGSLGGTDLGAPEAQTGAVATAAETVGTIPFEERRPAAVPGTQVHTPPTPAAGDQLRLTQRVILHIGAQGTLRPDDIAPPELTQGGMSAKLGASQNTVTNVLRRLAAAGVLTQDVRHVRGRPRRLRVYRFTPRGEAIYSDLRRRVAESQLGESSASSRAEASESTGRR
jgi:PKD repeat protein/DNA-binding MarR family transcriptional regulator